MALVQVTVPVPPGHLVVIAGGAAGAELVVVKTAAVARRARKSVWLCNAEGVALGVLDTPGASATTPGGSCSVALTGPDLPSPLLVTVNGSWTGLPPAVSCTSLAGPWADSFGAGVGVLGGAGAGLVLGGAPGAGGTGGGAGGAGGCAGGAGGGAGGWAGG
ncbi:MAG: hypothetical protein ACRDRL_01595, partial [Sciscionella sp.]